MELWPATSKMLPGQLKKQLPSTKDVGEAPPDPSGPVLLRERRRPARNQLLRHRRCGLKSIAPVPRLRRHSSPDIAGTAKTSHIADTAEPFALTTTRVASEIAPQRLSAPDSIAP
jgi:hypothetical protein